MKYHNSIDDEAERIHQKELLHEREEYKHQLAEANMKVTSLNINTWAANAMGWCRDTFGGPIATNVVERAARLLEEATEVAQAAGVPPEMAEAIRSRVYSRPAGELSQELGGVIVCWGVMCAALGTRPTDIMEKALLDCWARQDVIRAKLADKIKAGTSPSVLSPTSIGNRPLESFGQSPRIPTGSPFRSRAYDTTIRKENM